MFPGELAKSLDIYAPIVIIIIWFTKKFTKFSIYTYYIVKFVQFKLVTISNLTIILKFKYGTPYV